MPRRYFAIDGGSGAHLLAALATQTPYLQPVASPRHANLLIVCGPVTRKLVPAIAAIARALPRPAHALILNGRLHGIMSLHPSIDDISVHPDELFSGARTIEPESVKDILDTVFAGDPWPALHVRDIPETEPDVIQLPPQNEQEMATELAVLSLGPVQPFTAGPLRLVLVCDGEQVLSAQVETGYARRGIAEAMMQATWQEGLALARLLDPLAPIAGQLAYIQAIEQLQGWTPPTSLNTLREAVLALERAQNALWWTVSFARVLDDQQLLDNSSSLASICADTNDGFWRQSPLIWIAPQHEVSFAVVHQSPSTESQLHEMIRQIDLLIKQIERNRLLGLRTRGIGVIDVKRLLEAGASGPVLRASREGKGDVQSRLVTRLRAAAADIGAAIDALTAARVGQAQLQIANEEAQWAIPAGETQAVIEGPRGAIGLRLTSDGRPKPALVEWQRPSATLLTLLPGMLAEQKLVDAETILASLDLSMAEADG